jgi:hypothetical protein
VQKELEAFAALGPVWLELNLYVLDGTDGSPLIRTDLVPTICQRLFYPNKERQAVK